METISIIIPCYNEEEAIPVYYETMVRQMDEMEEQQKIKRKEIPYMEIAIGCQVRKSLHQDEDEVIKAADQNMYEDKKRKKAMEWK